MDIKNDDIISVGMKVMRRAKHSIDVGEVLVIYKTGRAVVIWKGRGIHDHKSTLKVDSLIRYTPEIEAQHLAVYKKRFAAAVKKYRLGNEG